MKLAIISDIHGNFYDIEFYLGILRESDLPVKDCWISQIHSPGN